MHDHLLPTCDQTGASHDQTPPLRARSARFGGDGRPQARQRRGRPRGGSPLCLLLGASWLVALVACGDDTSSGTSSTGTAGGGSGGADATSTGTSTQSGNPTSSGGGEGGGSGSTSTSTSTGGEGGAGGSSSTGAIQNCVPEELGDDEEIGADCQGWFVDPSADEGVADGSRDAPYATLERALEVAQDGERIYVCGTAAGPQTEGSLTVERSVAIHGGWGCATWTKFDGESRWTAAAGEIPLRVVGDDVEVLVQGFAIEAASAVEAGGSSIAVLVDGATVEFADSSIVAGAGADGADGEESLAVATPITMNGTNGAPGCVTSASVDGGEFGTNSCGVVLTPGGSGGDGNLAIGSPGTPGSPDGLGGDGGTGQTTMALCANGEGGTAGTDGNPGAGATADGEISASGFTPAGGTPGASNGTHGGGGGGGGGARACSTNASFAGPSGGGGGAGGCGGLLGQGGGGGGGSFGVVTISGTLSLRRTTVTATTGGAGGDGAAGQPGQAGGSAGINVGANACDGGPGGNGGQGGSGGGGRGGHSVAIALAGGSAVNLDGTSDLQFGEPGLGGQGGVGERAGNEGGDGENGVAAEQHEF